MSFETYSLFVLTVLVVMLTPGPSTILGAVQGMRFGVRAGVFTALGDISANFLQMIAAVAGLGLLLSQSVVAFTVVKVLGVAYLIYFGIKMISAKDSPLTSGPARNKAPQRTPLWHAKKGFVVAGTSPKAILFYGALFPQFVSVDTALLPQFALLAATCMVIDFCVVVMYATLAAKSAQAVQGPKAGKIVNRAGGGLMLGTAGLLATQSP